MRRLLVGISAVAASLAFAIVSYPRLPHRVPVHWNANFEVDSYGPRAWVFVFPLAALIVFPLLAYALPRFDPRRRNYAKFGTTYWFVWNAIMGFLAAFEVIIVGAALGWEVRMPVLVPLLIGALLIVLGNVMGRVRPNWFVGIRTPWTLSSDEVWRKTHRLGAKTMIAGGAIVLLSAVLPTGWPKVVPLIVAVAFATGVPLVYSYLEWRRLGRPEHPAA